jgi:hypothetical protein
VDRSLTRASGQAAPEYIAVVLVVALVIALVGAVAGPNLAAPVAGTIRTGICIVTGDICRTADAAALGLPPCVANEGVRGRSAGVQIFRWNAGGKREWTLTLRSDGTAEVAVNTQLEGGVTMSGEVSALHFTLGGAASLSAHYQSGSSWSFTDAPPRSASSPPPWTARITAARPTRHGTPAAWT